MRSIRALSLCAVLGLLSVCAFGQAWSGILAPARAIDWTNAGGGVGSGSWTQCGSTIAAGATTATIQTAINNCTANHFVLLGAGSFTLSAALHFNSSSIELRGSGPTSTTIVENGNNILFGDGPANQGSTPSGLTVTNLTTLTQGSTVLTVASTAGMSSGQVVMIYEANDTYVNPVGNEGNENATMCPSSPGLNFFGCSTRSMAEMHQITNVNSGANQITIEAPGLSKLYASGLTPQVFFWSTTGPTSSNGIQNVKIDAGDGSANHTATDFAVAFVFCNSCWAKNIAVVNAHRAGIYALYSYKTEIRDSYVAASNTAGAPTEYGIEVDRTSLFKVENNIMFGVTSPVVIETAYGGVVGYNYTLNSATDNLFPTLDSHLAHTSFILFEGNATSFIDWDMVHGSASHGSHFRNFMWGTNPNKTNFRTPINFDAYQRYMNMVANVLGDPTLHTQYVCDQANPQGSDNFIYGIGWFNGCFGVGTSYDTVTETSLMRWGNWDGVTWKANGNTNGIRECTGSGAGNAACTASETANGDATFPGLASPATSFPSSFYNGVTGTFASCGTGLSFWKNPGSGTCPIYPPIGPDVTCSTNCVANTAFHVTKIPAQLCYEATTKASGFLTAFDATNCYSADLSGSASAPTFSAPSCPYTGPSTNATISDPNSGTHIVCYRVGATPATNGIGTGCSGGSTQYSGAIAVNATSTINAIAGTSTLSDSTVTSCVLTITGSVPLSSMAGAASMSGKASIQ